MNAGASPIRILAVDDHPIVRQGIAGLINIQSDMVLVGEASDGREAIQLFRTHRPDITLMDLQMPRMNGVETMRELRRLQPALPIVMTSGYGAASLDRESEERPPNAVLAKPYPPAELVATLRAVMKPTR